MQVEAKNFHPMRGHVDDGMEVKFANGSSLTVRPCGIGWALFDTAGKLVTPRALDAYQLTRAIVELDTQP